MASNTPFVLDFSAVGDDLIPEGEHSAFIGPIKLTTTQSGNPALNWEILFPDDGDLAGRKVWFTTSLSPKALWNLKAIFGGLGLDVSGQMGLVFTDDEAKLLVDPNLTGMACTAVIYHEDYLAPGQSKPEKRHYVRTLLGVGGGEPAAGGSFA